jgi:5-methylcytosine-specific restriction endonuclease McrA
MPRLKTCTSCGRAYAPSVRWHGKCPRCAPAGRDLRSPTTRAQDATYVAERARVLEPGPDGRPPRCALRIACAGAPATTVDHIIPVARGGQHVGNLQPACMRCNSMKRATRGVWHG